MNFLKAKIPEGRVKLKVGDHIRITKVKLYFAKVYEQTLSTEIYGIIKVIHRVPQPV